MSCPDFRPSLSELVDGTLPREQRLKVESHLESCADCRAVLADLRHVRELARALPKAAAPESVWLKVKAAVEAGRGGPAPRAVSPSERVLRFVPRRRAVLAGLAAAAALVMAASAGVYFMTGRQNPAPQTQAPAHVEPAQTVQSIESELTLADQHYEKAIAALEQVAKDGQASLDPQTVAVLQKNHGILDQAIRESRAALRSQPTSDVAQASLFEALQRKVALLRDTVALINEMRKGDQAGTAKIVGTLGKG